jgi:hypothetical protein
LSSQTWIWLSGIQNRLRGGRRHPSSSFF